MYQIKNKQAGLKDRRWEVKDEADLPERFTRYLVGEIYKFPRI